MVETISSLAGFLILLVLVYFCFRILRKRDAVPPNLRLTLPEVIYAVPGIETNIYFENVIDSANFNAYAVEVKCERGAHGNLRWFWTPGEQDAGKTFELELRLFNDYGLVISAPSKVVVAGESACRDRKITLSLLADSGVNCSYPEHLLQLMREAGFDKYTPVGIHSGGGREPLPGGIAHDGYGGFSWGCFLERWFYAPEELPHAQTEAEREQMLAFGVRDFPQDRHYLLRSPLLKVVNGKKILDIPAWLDRINEGKSPDFIIIQLGGNDMFIAAEEERVSRLAQTLNNARKLLGELRKYAPNAIIGVTTGVCGCDQDGYGANYQCLQSRYQYRRNIQSYNLGIAALVKELSDPNLSLIPLNQCIDPNNSYLSESCPIHARHEGTTVRASNALHPSIAGGYQLADAIYCWLRKQLEIHGNFSKISS